MQDILFPEERYELQFKKLNEALNDQFVGGVVCIVNDGFDALQNKLDNYKPLWINYEDFVSSKPNVLDYLKNIKKNLITIKLSENSLYNFKNITYLKELIDVCCQLNIKIVLLIKNKMILSEVSDVSSRLSSFFYLYF